MLTNKVDAVTGTFWTPATLDIQPFGTMQLFGQNYSSVFRPKGHNRALPPDFNITLGVFKHKKIEGELGLDYLGGTDNPLFFNGRFGAREDAFFKGSPGFNVGFFGFGTKRHVTDQNILDFVVGKTFPETSLKVFGGAYKGLTHTLSPDTFGGFIGFEYGFATDKYYDGTEYKKCIINGDYASGKNAIGGGGVSFSYYFTPQIYLQTGPVWFSDRKINGSWKWGTIFVVNVPIWGNSKARPETPQSTDK